MDEYGEYEINDVVLLEDTADEFSGKPARVIDQHMGLVKVKIVVDKTGEFIERVYSAEAMGLVISASLPTQTELPIEKCCSVCSKINWDNRNGGYREKHVNKDTGIEVLCDDLGKLYVDGYLVPPALRV